MFQLHINVPHYVSLSPPSGVTMREVPECLNRRYQALDDLVKELSSAMSNPSSDYDYLGDQSNNAGVKLMCDFWNILKEDPDCNLTVSS